MKKLLLLLSSCLFSVIAFSQFPTSGTESFENTTGPDTALPTAQSVWTLATGFTGNQWAVFDNGIGLSKRWGITSTTNNSHSGSNSAFIEGEQIGINNTSEDYLATPLVTIPSNGILSFWTKSNFSNNETIYSIKINTNLSVNSQTTISNYQTTIATWNNLNLTTTFNTFEKKEINLSAYAGQQIYIAFLKTTTQTTTNFNNNNWIIDDVSFSTSQCAAPSQLTATSVTNTSAIMSWTENGTSTAWEIVVFPSGVPFPGPNSVGIQTVSNPFMITGLNANTCYVFYVKAICPSSSTTQWVGPHNFCTTPCQNSSSCPDKLELIAFLDSNNNGSLDGGETSFNHGDFSYEINNSGTIQYGTNSYGGYYIFDADPNNSYNLGYTINTNYSSYFSSQTNYNNITIPLGSGTHTYYFPITRLQPLNDIQVDLYPNGNPRPGFYYGNTIAYRNNGDQTISSGTITFTKSPLVTISNISVSGTTPTPTGFTYNFNNLNPSEIRYLYVDMQVPTIPIVNLGDLITNSVTIEPIINDSFPLNNAATLSQIVVGSYDPNDKCESHGGKIALNEFSSNDYLTYTIQFENTGTANAEFIRVEDELNSLLNPNSVEMISSSHDYNLKRIGNKLIWFFYDINLPPSTSANPLLGHGFVQFKIKPNSGYSVGTIIPNKADIYFDYNPPIITNTFETEFVQSLKVDTFENNDFSLYPNPTNTSIVVSLNDKNGLIQQLQIIDVLGKSVKEVKTNASKEIKIDVSDLSKGVYLVEILSENNIKATKKLVIN